MAVQLLCPNLQCRKVLSVGDESRGKTVRCQHCKVVFKVPEAKRLDVASALNTHLGGAKKAS
jgi:hypothetical protein